MITPKFKVWLQCALIRSVRTIAQTMVATIGTAVALSDVDWGMIISTSILAGILSILTSIATGLPEADAKEEARKLQEARALNDQDK
jgi:ABC-type protease/lipase transport system fused ATPase/permease subunit